MTIDSEKLLNLDYTAYDHAKDFQDKLDEQRIRQPSIQVEKDYDKEGVPNVVVIASDRYKDSTYIDTYRLENVTREEFEEVMFDTWEMAMEELEHELEP